MTRKHMPISEAEMQEQLHEWLKSWRKRHGYREVQFPVYPTTEETASYVFRSIRNHLERAQRGKGKECPK